MASTHEQQRLLSDVLVLIEGQYKRKATERGLDFMAFLKR